MRLPCSELADWLIQRLAASLRASAKEGGGLLKMFDTPNPWQNSIVHSSAQAWSSLCFEHWRPEISCRYSVHGLFAKFVHMFAGMVSQFCVLQFRRAQAICV